jgi:UDP-N-acetylmuramoylalanine--D-glutamate ligase
VETFRPDIGIVTNLSPDHLDRYQTVAAYYADKGRLFDTADERSLWVLPSEDDVVGRLIGDAPGRRYYFGGTKLEAEDGSPVHAFIDGDRLTLLVDGALEALCPVADLPLLGRHNVVNALAASLAARLAGAEVEAIARGLRSARPLPHRLEPVAERGGVLWVNDSKATNVAASRSALESLDRPVVLLLGGKDKGEDFGPLGAAFPDRVRAVVAYGAAGPRIAEELVAALAGVGGPPQAPRTSVELVKGGLDDVVARAAARARPGDVVLLSPACSSFDMFESYEHRGRAFAELARGRS